MDDRLFNVIMLWQDPDDLETPIAEIINIQNQLIGSPHVFSDYSMNVYDN